MLKRSSLLAAVAISAVTLPSVGYAAPVIDLITPGGEYSGAPFSLGFEFSTDTAQAIDALGVYDNLGDGLTNAAQIGLWSMNGTLLTSATIGAGTGTLNGLFRYVSISPFALTPGTRYIVGAYSRDFASSLGTSQGGTGNINPLVTIFKDRYTEGSSLSFPSFTDNHTGGAWLGANFNLVSIASAVPEPSSWAMMIIGFGAIGAALRRRQNVTRRVTFAT